PLTRIHIFALIDELLQICSVHKESGESAKAEEVGDQLGIVFDSDPTNKVVVFTRWIYTLEYLARRWRHFRPLLFHGSMSPQERERVVGSFKQDGRLLLMSVKAAGRGLNLQEASYVYHFDLTWNPMDQRQAEDRCWRQGQRKTVFVYSYVQQGTIEERIHQVLQRKSHLFGAYVDTMAEDTDATVQAKWSIEELKELLRPSHERAPR
ncbi:MAG TPA: C-terminal helicase domain-containing protein, partial [Chthonomonadales bacterium]|nr:C-terminal helicase domain-containing protein [Chthonomonadales bacterium]